MTSTYERNEVVKVNRYQKKQSPNFLTNGYMIPSPGRLWPRAFGEFTQHFLYIIVVLLEFNNIFFSRVWKPLSFHVKTLKSGARDRKSGR